MLWGALGLFLWWGAISGRGSDYLYTAEADSLWGLTAAPGSEAWGLFLKRGAEVYAVINGESFGPYQDPGELVFSEDGSTWGFLSEGLAVINGRRYGPYPGAVSLVLSPRGSSWGVIFRDGAQVAINGRLYGPYDRAHHLIFSHDGSSWACLAEKNGRDYAVINGRARAGRALDLWLSPEGSFWVLVGEDSVITPARTYPLRLSWDFARPAFAASGSTWGFLSEGLAVINGRRYGPYEKVSCLSVSGNGRAWAFGILKGGKRYVVFNGQEQGPLGPEPYWREGIVLSEDGSSWGFVGFPPGGEGRCVVINGEVKGCYEDATGLVFSGNGASWGVRIFKEGQEFALINGREHGPYPGIWLMGFCRDGTAWGLARGPWHESTVVINGREHGPYEMVAWSQKPGVFWGLKRLSSGKWGLARLPLKE